MKRITCLVTVIAAFAFMLCLAGCGSNDSIRENTSTSNLNKTISVYGLTCDISSDWEEYDFDSSSGDVINGYNFYSIEDNINYDSNYVTIYYSNLYLDNDVEEDFNSYIEGLKNSGYGDYSNFKSSEIGNSVIDGAECTIYELTYDFKPSDTDEHYYTDECIVYIMGSKLRYSIIVCDDDSVSTAQAILDTVSIE